MSNCELHAHGAEELRVEVCHLQFYGDRDVGLGADACGCGEGCLRIRQEALVMVLDKEERVSPNIAKLISNTLRSHISFNI